MVKDIRAHAQWHGQNRMAEWRLLSAADGTVGRGVGCPIQRSEELAK